MSTHATHPLIDDSTGEGRFSVSRSIFSGQQLFDEEMKRIFEGGWVYLAHESQLPGPNDYITVRLGTRSVIAATKRSSFHQGRTQRRRGPPSAWWASAVDLR